MGGKDVFILLLDVYIFFLCEQKELVLTVVITCRSSVSNGKWEKLEGKFSLSTMPDKVVFYLEGPSPGVDLLIQSVVISCSSPNECRVPFLIPLIFAFE